MIERASNWKRRASGFVDGIEAEGVDPRQKKMMIMVGLLAVVFGVVLFFLYGPPSKSAPKPSKAETVATTAETAKAGPIWPTPDPYPVTLRDPMSYEFPDDTPPEPEPGPGPEPEPGPAIEEEPVVAAPVLPDLEVTAIMISEREDLAMVNGYLVGEGEVVLGARVVSIEAEQVVFEFEGVRWVKKRKQE